jgi:hypothetical protein
MRDYDNAISDSDETIRLDPKNALAFVLRGLDWHAKRDSDKATSPTEPGRGFFAPEF